MNTITPQTYIESGYDITILRPRTKKPKLKDWPNITLNAKDFDGHGIFPEHYNIGIKLGASSDGIVDVDLDCDAAVSLGTSLLNTDTQVFGRAGNPGSHYLYRVPDPRNTLRFKHPITDEMLLELRGNGGQTVLPGSVYEDGSTIRFEDYSLPEPLVTDWDTLERQCGFIAAGCVLSELWTEGSRHQLAVALGGWAAHKGIDQLDFMRLIEAVANHTNDDDIADRVECVRDSYNDLATGNKVAWKNGLKRIDNRVMAAISEWLMVKAEPERNSVRERPKKLSRACYALVMSFSACLSMRQTKATM